MDSLIINRQGFSGDLGVDPNASFLVYRDDQGKVIGRKDTEHYKMDAFNDFVQCKKFIMESYWTYIRAFPEQAKQVELECAEAQRRALNSLGTTPNKTWRIALKLPVEFELFIKRFIPNYMENKNLLTWMMRNMPWFCVPAKV